MKTEHEYVVTFTIPALAGAGRIVSVTLELGDDGGEYFLVRRESAKVGDPLVEVERVPARLLRASEMNPEPITPP